ncbi:Uma2 family endonuclease [Hymenobacter sp. ASUV-10]|uniref:Uma2 family endonuclease n=1 Tax=Hymenobacter aranciens TaxID=3063996 RepID=A0ABT9BCJ4_9BACT|nr:Uma2 family endonuclease [Hymenobacter sp. ASUV-10]MDO7874421.1 Uma2 family endonuclease [Hymenobacter sp. ASUV-10]
MATPITSLAQLDPNGSYTYADYLTWQFTELVELWRGKIMRRMSAPTDLHQVVAGELYATILYHLRRQTCQVRIAPYDVRLIKLGTPAHPADTAIRTVVQPDVCVICDPTKLEKRGCLGAPDLLIEVTSPSTQARDWKDKYDLYEENGVTEYWIVSPDAASISIFVLDEATARYRLVGEYAEPGPVPCHTLPGLGLDWADVFPPATPA